MAAITKQALENASTDAQALANAVNGAANRSNPGHADGTVSTRLGQLIRTLARIDSDFELDALTSQAALDYLETRLVAIGAPEANAARITAQEYRTAGWVNPKEYAGGAAVTGAHLATAATAAAAAGFGLLIAHPVTITTGLGTISVPLRFEGGGKLVLNAGGSITISGPVTAPLSQICDTTGGGALTFGAKVTEIYPQWWGAVGDGVTDDRAAIQAALNAVPAGGGRVHVPRSPNSYLLSGSVLPRSHTLLSGDGHGSCLQVQSGGWDTTPSGPNPHATDNHGAIVLAGVSNVRITHLRVRSAKNTTDAYYEHSPTCITMNTVSNVTIDHTRLENAHYSVLWTGGTEEGNSGITFTDNEIYDASYVAQSDQMGNGGGGVVQFNAQHVVVANNRFERVGCGVSATGEHITVVGNTFKDFQALAVFVGDDTYVRNVVVANNVFDTTPALTPGGAIAVPTAIHVANSLGDQHSTVSVIGNRIFARITSGTARFIGVVVSGVDAHVAHNVVDVDLQYDGSGDGTAHRYIGFQWRQSALWGPTITAAGNAVHGYSSTGVPMAAARGISGYIMSPGSNKLTVYEEGDSVHGLPETCVAWGYQYDGGANHFAAYLTNVINRGGGQLIGQQSTNTSTRNKVLSLAYDSAVHASNWQPGFQNYSAVFGDLTVTGQVTASLIANSDLIRADVPADAPFRFSHSGAPMAEIRYGEVRVPTLRLGSATGWGFDGPAVRAGSGVPSNGTGSDGDFYLRSDGGSGTTMYQRRSGSYVGIL